MSPEMLGPMDGCTTREERIAAAREAFVRVDKDGSGTIELDELQYLLNLAGVYPTAAEMDILYKRFDLDRDGEVSLAEFLEVMVDDWEEQEIEEEFREVQELFTRLDKDGSQRLDVKELKELIRLLGVNLKGGEIEDRIVEKLYRKMKSTGVVGGGDSVDGVSLDEFAAFLVAYHGQEGEVGAGGKTSVG